MSRTRTTIGHFSSATPYVIAGVAALLLAGCAGDAAESESTGADASTGDVESPLAEYLGSMSVSGSGVQSVSMSRGSQEMSEQERLDFQRVEELVAECMRAEGFEYVPVSVDDVESAASAYDEASALEPEQFVREYGYGITTFIGSRAEEEIPDPNHDIRERLSESARDVYDRALWGEMAQQVVIDEDDGVAEFSTDNLDMGCQGEAASEVYGADGGRVISSDMGDFDQLFDDIWALQERIQRDPHVADAIDEWRHCMADGGYPDFEHPEDPQQSVLERLIDLEAADTDPAEPSDDEHSEISIVGGSRGPDIDPEKLAELHQYEIDVATVDVACQQRHYEETYRDVAFAMEEEFVDQHRDELEQYRDWLAGSGGLG